LIDKRDDDAPPACLPSHRGLGASSPALAVSPHVRAVGEDLLYLDDGHTMAGQVRFVAVVDLDLSDPDDPSSRV